MRKPVLRQLVWELTDRYGLTPTKNIGVEDNVALFLYMEPHNVQEQFQHSSETIHNHFHRVLEVVYKIRPVDSMHLASS